MHRLRRESVAIVENTVSHQNTILKREDQSYRRIHAAVHAIGVVSSVSVETDLDAKIVLFDLKQFSDRNRWHQRKGDERKGEQGASHFGREDGRGEK